MKFFTIAAAMSASLVASTAQAAVLMLEGRAFARGSITDRNYDKTTVTAHEQDFTFHVDASDMKVGETRKFSIGPNSNAGVIYGAFYRDGLDTFVGTNFYFNQTQFLSDGRFREVSLSTNGFSLQQVSPPAVPEPATWALMILGFGAIGYSMRHRQKVAVRFA